MSLRAEELSESEKSKWKNIFDVVDLNGDGKISKEEIEKVAKGMGYPITQTEAEDLISKCDSDNSGNVTFDEFCVALIKAGVKFRVASFLCGLFYEMDANHDGQVTADEAKQLIAKAGCGDRIPESAIDAFIKQADKDGDGQVNVHEFLAYIREKLHL